jgi:hypothetical protein
LTPDKGWNGPFDDPIPLPRGRKLVALEDAGKYITKLPKSEHEAREWQAAMQALILVATSGRPDDACADRRHESLEPPRRTCVRRVAQRHPSEKAEAEKGPMKTIWVYINTAKEVGDVDHIKVFANVDAAEKWFEENDPEGVAFEYEVIEASAAAL